MTKTKVKGGKRVVVKLNPMTFKRMINDIIKKLYGTGSCGELKYCFHDAGLNYLNEAAESFLENMWEQLRGMSDNEITTEHIQRWKRDTGFKLRVQNNRLSLCALFNK